MKRILAAILSLSLMLCALSGCGNTSSGDTTPTPGGNTAPVDTETPTGTDAPKGERPKFLTIGTAAAGAAFYPIGIGMADIITNQVNVSTTAQVTGGAIENIGLVQDATVDMAITMGNTAQQAYEGTGDYEGQAYTNLNALYGGLSKGVFHVVVMDNSSIQTMADLKGKKVVMGPAGNGGISVAQDVWAQYGFGLEDVNATYISYTDGISSLTDGNCDAVVVQSAAPASAIQELAASGKGFRFIPVEEDVAQKLCDEHAYFGSMTLSKDTYGNDEDTLVMYINTMVIIRADLDADLVYDITKALFENLDTIKESHPAAKGLTLEGAVRTSIPLHPGAQRYFEEIRAI